MPDPQDRWASNQGVELHYLDSGQGADRSLIPVLFVPGALGAAEDYAEEIAALTPRRCVAISLRGRGQSDAPPEGYSFVNHIRDIEAVIDDARLEDFCLVGYSMGAAYAIGYVVLNPTRAVGLILGDYPARYPQISEGWVEANRQQYGARVPPHVIQAIQRESALIELWDDLPQIERPVLLLRGDQPGALLSAEDADRYIQLLPQAMAVVFPGSGHALWEPDKDRYFGTIRAFLQGLDALE